MIENSAIVLFVARVQPLFQISLSDTKHEAGQYFPKVMFY